MAIFTGYCSPCSICTYLTFPRRRMPVDTAELGYLVRIMASLLSQETFFSKCRVLISFFLVRMTGVGGRPEIVIEGSDSLDGPWKVMQL